jgi:hypothetical protein
MSSRLTRVLPKPHRAAFVGQGERRSDDAPLPCATDGTEAVRAAMISGPIVTGPAGADDAEGCEFGEPGSVSGSMAEAKGSSPAAIEFCDPAFLGQARCVPLLPMPGTAPRLMIDAARTQVTTHVTLPDDVAVVFGEAGA